MDKRSADAVITTYDHLTGTQKAIIQYLYGIANLHEISLEKLFDQIQQRDGKATIKSKAELFYRIKDLVNQGLLSIESKGWKATVIHPKPEVRELLHVKIESE